MITKICPTCGGEGKLFDQLDVDVFVPREVCPECDGNEWVNILCDACGKPFTDAEWNARERYKYSDVVFHERCMENPEHVPAHLSLTKGDILEQVLNRLYKKRKDRMNACYHCTGIRIFHIWKFEIWRCEWGCNRITFEWA